MAANAPAANSPKVPGSGTAARPFGESRRIAAHRPAVHRRVENERPAGPHDQGRSVGYGARAGRDQCAGLDLRPAAVAVLAAAQDQRAGAVHGQGQFLAVIAIG